MPLRIFDNFFWEPYTNLYTRNQEIYPARLFADVVALNLDPGYEASIQIFTLPLTERGSMGLSFYPDESAPDDENGYEKAGTSFSFGNTTPGAFVDWGGGISADAQSYVRLAMPQVNLGVRNNKFPNGKWDDQRVKWRDSGQSTHSFSTGFYADSKQTDINTLLLLFDMYKYQQANNLPLDQDEFSGITGTQLIEVQGAIMVRTKITKVPDGAGRDARTPQQIFHMGRVSFGHI